MRVTAEDADDRPWVQVALFALPGLLLAVAGLTHPHHLTIDSAGHWWRMHVVLLPLFPLLGFALAALVRGRRDPLAWVVRLGAYAYATGYGALDLLAGVATGYVIDPAVSAGDGPAPEAVPRLFAIGNDLGTIGAWAFLAAAVLVAADAVRRTGLRAVAPGLLLVVASVSFLDSHIYRWIGVITVLLIGLATGWLRSLRPSSSTRPAARSR